ncbi:MAG: YgiQ family radical SAM protein [bacterium]
MFLPTTREEMERLGWTGLDVILVSGDTYIDSPFSGVALIGKVLLEKGYRVGIIAQPCLDSARDIARLGEPSLFWGVTSGSVDSMVSNYTASGKRRNRDDLTPGGFNARRPDRALIAYANLIRRHFKHTVPVVMGGIEASLRRIAHYDYWSDAIRRSILFDAKADIIVYGMGERACLEIAERLKKGSDLHDCRGICCIGDAPPHGYIRLPSFEEAADDRHLFSRMFTTFYENTDPVHAQGLCQRHGKRYLIQNPPQPDLSAEELDRVYNLDYEREVHPFHAGEGGVKAIETIRFSITTHRGCYGECSFCALSIHQGRRVVSRSEESILKEAEAMTRHPAFKGIIADVGGPTANMYGIECGRKEKSGACKDRHCLFPSLCPTLKPSHLRQVNLLRRLRGIPKVTRVFVASGIRYDLILSDKRSGETYLRELAAHHISGQLKVAPEHVADHVLRLMGKPSRRLLLRFRQLFFEITRELGARQFLTYYFIAAHPGCTTEDMMKLKRFAARELRLRPEQVQIFTPTPSTFSTLMYWTGIDPWTGEGIFVERDRAGRERQKRIMKYDARRFMEMSNAP